jgi:hypothetical protein
MKDLEGFTEREHERGLPSRLRSREIGGKEPFLGRAVDGNGADEAATHEFLAARIENVMQFEKFKAKAKGALSNFPALAQWMKPKE